MFDYSEYCDMDIIHAGADNAPTLILVRGLPGSGKSTMAKKLKNHGDIHLEADMYFYRKGNGYQWNAEELHRAHSWCELSAEIFLNQNRHNPHKKIIVSNTFNRPKTMTPYIKAGLSVNAKIAIFTLKKEFGSIHGLSEGAMQRMRDNSDTHQELIEKLYANQ